jgi:hypothetical protein
MLNVISNREVSEAEWDATVRFLELGGQYFVLNRIEWTDAHIPRTERPVRFYPNGRPTPYPGPTDVCVELAYGSTFRMSEPVRVF